MAHTWISTADGDLLRADQIRQITIVEGLRAVTAAGSQFLIAEINGREATLTAARALAAAIAEADARSHATEIDVVRDERAWTVRLTTMPDAALPATG